MNTEEIIKATILGEEHLGENLKRLCIEYIDNLKQENQQKEFIDYLKNEISNCENIIAKSQEKSYYYNNNLKEELTEKSQKSYQKRILLEEILSKYKEIIGGKE